MMDEATRKALNELRDRVVAPALIRNRAAAVTAAAAAPKDERPRYTGKHPLAGQLRDPLARFREMWGSDQEIHDLLLDELTPPDVKEACEKANNWYLKNHALAERDAAAEDGRKDELRAIARFASLDEERYVNDGAYREAAAPRIGEAVRRQPIEAQREALDAELSQPLPDVPEPAAAAAKVPAV